MTKGPQWTVVVSALSLKTTLLIALESSQRFQITSCMLLLLYFSPKSLFNNSDNRINALHNHQIFYYIPTFYLSFPLGLFPLLFPSPNFQCLYIFEPNTEHFLQQGIFYNGYNLPSEHIQDQEGYLKFHKPWMNSRDPQKKILTVLFALNSRTGKLSSHVI